MTKPDIEKSPPKNPVKDKSESPKHANIIALIKEEVNKNPEFVVSFLNNRYSIEMSINGRCVSPTREGASNPTSFFWNANGTYHDFGESDEILSHGDIFDLIMRIEGCDFKTACNILADAFSLDFDSVGLEEAQKNRALRQLLFFEMESVISYSAFQLTQHPEILAILTQRGFSEEFIRKRRIGYLPCVYGFHSWLKQTNPEYLPNLYLGNMVGRLLIPYLDESGRKAIYLIGRLT